MNWRDYAKYAQQSIDELARDCEMQVFRSKGPGGQGVNTTDSAVRMTHVPTGITGSRRSSSAAPSRRACARRPRCPRPHANAGWRISAIGPS